MKKLGRPKLEICPDDLKRLMKFRLSLPDTAGWFNCSEDTIERRIKELEGKTFAEFQAKYLAHTKYDLIKRSIDLALSGNVAMLKFCLKNLCGWEEHPVPKANEHKTITLNYNLIDDPDEYRKKYNS